MHTLITEIRDKQNITKEQLQLLLETDNQEMIEELMVCARTEAQKVYGNKVYMRGLIEFTNYCKNNCIYCGIRRDNCICLLWKISLIGLAYLLIGQYVSGRMYLNS